MFLLNRIIIVFCCAYGLTTLSGVGTSIAAMDPRFELDPQALGIMPSPAKPKAVKPGKRAVRSGSDKGPSVSSAKGSVHTVKPGDNLFKILMRDYGLSNDEADAFIEDIRRENNILDIKRLKVGQKIVIPPINRASGGTLQGSTGAKAYSSGQTLLLESPVAPLSEHEAADRMRQAWDRIVPPGKDTQKPVSLQSPAFSLTLDPVRFPVYTAMDGSRILVDQSASIPPLIKSLIIENDPSIRIVSGSPQNGRHFIAALLESAGFYSVEENFSMDFGADPKLTIHSDFKVEKTPESLIKQDVVLINSGRASLPSTLGDFLKKEGFVLLEPFGSPVSAHMYSPRQLFQISSKDQREIIDSILESLSVTADKDKRVDVFAADNNGISLSVKADRYFEHNGARCVVTRFGGDPYAYTLFRILEAKGYQVVILEDQDGFRKVAEKLLTRMRYNSAFARHQLGPEDSSNYSLQMSGIKIEGSGLRQGEIFLTDLELDPIIRNLLQETGYSIFRK